MVLLRVVGWLDDAMRREGGQGRAGRDATLWESGDGANEADDGQSSNPARLIPPRSGSR
jgi:hypothetical protein